MKKILITLLKFILLVSVLCIIGLLTFGLVIWMKWSWWVGLCFILAYIGLYCMWVLVRKILLRRREKHFVNEVIAQDDTYRQNLGDGDFTAEQDLQTRWKEAIETLNQSHLGKSGNPLYVLPWYMIIGESRSGKTTAIQSSRLSAPFAEIKNVSGLAGTKNCDWWFFEQAVILDTAGRYAIPLEEGRDRKEWQKFLSLLVKYRKKQALNGLIVTIAADKLLQSSEESIGADGRSIRQRIDELMRVLGMKFPVYVLVTKCDLVQGMTRFCECLPEKCLDQAMGFLNNDLSKDASSLVDKYIKSIQGKLKDLRLLLFGSGTANETAKLIQSPELLLFPEEFSQLDHNLKVFMEAAFKENPYQETPILRGIYFSSGKQEGTPYSHFLNKLGLVKQQDVLPGTNRGFFLHDLFAKVMTGDRGLYAPTRNALAWSRLTRNIGLTAWVTIILSVCGLLSFSFVKNLTTLQSVSDAFDQPIVLQGEILTDTSIMERFQSGISSIEQTNNSWWFPRLGLYKSLEIEAEIKEKYCAQYKNEFARDFDKLLDMGVVELSSESSAEDMGQYIVHLAHRINLIRYRLEGQKMAGLEQMPQPSFQPFVSAADSALVSQVSRRIGTQYLHYLTWQNDEPVLQNEKKLLQKQLHHILTLPDSDLTWLAALINQDERFSYLSLEHFWGTTLDRQDIVSIPPAFTGEGKDAIETLVEQIENALPDHLAIAANKARFNKWYSRAYMQIWYDFARKFPQAEYYLQDREAWQQSASVMATDKGPYFALLKRMNEELSVLEDTQNEEWISLIRLFEKIWNEATNEKAIQEKKSMLAKVTKKGKATISKLEKGFGAAGAGKILESQMIGGVFFNDYQKSLSELVLATSSRKVSFQMATDIFKEDPAVSEAPMYVAQRNLIKLRNELSEAGAAKKTQVVWKLIAGPLTFLRDYAYLEAACKLNSLWEENVLVEVQDIRDKTELNNQFFGADGLALQFVKGVAAPFLGRNLEQGFYPREALGRMLPFRKEFLKFLTDGVHFARYQPDLRMSEAPLPAPKMQEKKQLENPIPPEPELKQNYNVLLTASPTSVNKGAKMIPHAVSLELICGAEVTRLVNLQYPVRQNFSWKPKDCQALSLNIEIGSLVLKKKYEDQYSFARFVKDYQFGAVTYTPNDFGAKQKQLKRLNVRTITVKFKASRGGDPLIAVMDQLEARKKALAEKEQLEGKDDKPNMAEILMSLENKRKAEELENAALKKAWKAKQMARTAQIKMKWEEQLPEVPRDITICWD